MTEVEKQKSVGQRLWIDHLSRLSIGAESLRYTPEGWSVTGLALSPQAICEALSDTDAYDYAIAKKLKEGMFGSPLLYSLIIEDVRQAADLLRPIYDGSDGVDGWSVMPVSPLFSNEYSSLSAKYRQVWDQIQRPNVLLLLPALSEYLKEIEDLVFDGVPLNITNIFSDQQFAATAKACLAGIERRLQTNQRVSDSIFISIEIDRLQRAMEDEITPQSARARTIATARTICRALHGLHDSSGWKRVIGAGNHPLRLVWAHSGDILKAGVDVDLHHTLNVPFTSVSLSHEMIAGYGAGTSDDHPMLAEGGDSGELPADPLPNDIDIDAEAKSLQLGHFDLLSREWALLLENIARKSARAVQRKGSATSESGIAAVAAR